MAGNRINAKQRISTSAKNANKKKYYKDQIDLLQHEHNSLRLVKDGTSEMRRMITNYKMFNNQLSDLSQFNHISNPLGVDDKDIPSTNIRNRDIVSSKIKALLGMELKRPFPWTAEATNPEATTRREQVEFGKLKEFVISQIMTPIKQEIEIKYQKELSNGNLPKDQMDKIKTQIAEETEAMTPPQVKKYMKEEHQDPAEIQANHLLKYLIQKTDLKNKFNDGFKHMNLSAKEVFYVGVWNGEPEVWNVNSRRFNSPVTDEKYTEDGEWATCEYLMTPSQIVSYFGNELKDKEIDQIYERHQAYVNEYRSNDWFRNEDEYDEDSDTTTLRVLHAVWKGLRKIGFLKYLDEEGQIQETIVFEEYKLNTDAGDISIEWEWLAETHEAWKVDDIYLRMGPVEGQFKDLDTIRECKLPYFGAICDNMNATPTCIMDRLRNDQFVFNVIMARIDRLLASDNGKKILIDINSIPNSKKFKMKDWLHYFQNSPITFYDSTEEGAPKDAANAAKVLDLSLASDIGKYIELAEYTRKRAGESIGIPDNVEGNSDPDQSVTNAQQGLVQSSNILEPYFDLHNQVKKNVLTALLEVSKIAYSGRDEVKLSYFLDDLSKEMFTLDIGLLDSSTLGIFLSDSTKAEETKQTLRTLAHASLQNQKIELSDVLSVLNQEGIPEAEATLKVAEDNRRKAEQALQQQTLQAQAEEEEKKREEAEIQREHEKEMVILEAEEKRKTEIQKASLLAASFNPDQDKDEDGVNDFVELARDGLNADIKQGQLQLDREKLEHQKVTDAKKLEIEEKRIKGEAGKAQKQ